MSEREEIRTMGDDRYQVVQSWEAGPGGGRVVWRVYDRRTAHTLGAYPDEGAARTEAARLNQRLADAVRNAARYRAERRSSSNA